MRRFIYFWDWRSNSNLKLNLITKMWRIWAKESEPFLEFISIRQREEGSMIKVQLGPEWWRSQNFIELKKFWNFWREGAFELASGCIRQHRHMLSTSTFSSPFFDYHWKFITYSLKSRRKSCLLLSGYAARPEYYWLNFCLQGIS